MQYVDDKSLFTRASYHRDREETSGRRAVQEQQDYEQRINYEKRRHQRRKETRERALKAQQIVKKELETKAFAPPLRIRKKGKSDLEEQRERAKDLERKALSIREEQAKILHEHETQLLLQLQKIREASYENINRVPYSPSPHLTRPIIFSRQGSGRSKYSRQSSGYSSAGSMSYFGSTQSLPELQRHGSGRSQRSVTFEPMPRHNKVISRKQCTSKSRQGNFLVVNVYL